jgi:hypothetical protein
MMWPHILVLIATLFLSGMGYWKRCLSKRLTSWEAITASIRSNAGIEQAVERFGWKAEVTVGTGEIWERIGGATGLANMYHNAGVYARLADYVMQHTSSIPKTVIEEIYTEATQVRVLVVFALASYLAFRPTSTYVNAYRAVQLYSAMAQHLTTVFRERCPSHFPKLMEVL